MQSLKEATAAKHEIAEHLPFNVKMFNGQLSKEEYLMHIVQQKAIFEAIEHIGLPDESLSRVNQVEEDIVELHEDGCTFDEVLLATKSYTDYLSTLNKETVLPHVYLNYLAILFGGQLMKKNVPSSGKMYEFENSSKAVKAVRRVQQDEWADEVNRAYDYVINIFKALDNKIDN